VGDRTATFEVGAATVEAAADVEAEATEADATELPLFRSIAIALFLPS